ncbi:MAG: transporter substrate-binding domain-containing protein [Candidatus Syntrophosphaera sp.]
MRRALLFLAIIILSLAFSCAKKKDRMTILTENYPPLSYIQDGQVTGYGTEVVEAIQAELGIDFTPRIKSWDEAYEKALNEPNVVIYTIEKTPARAGKFYFIGPLGANTASFYALRDNDLELATLEDARAVETIATTKNWFTEQYLREQGFTNLLSCETPYENIDMLLNKEAELAPFTDVTYPELAKAAGIDPSELKPVLKLFSSEYYIALSSKTDPQIILDWEQAFATIEKDGTLQQIREKWFPPIEESSENESPVDFN